jgi:hypothetical protein
MPFVCRSLDLFLPRQYAVRMRWEGFFRDLDGQMSASQQLGFESEITDLARAESAGIEFADRIRGSSGSSVTVQLTSRLRFDGVLSRVGEAWFLLETEVRSVLIRSAEVLTVQGLSGSASRPSSALRHGFGSAVRLLARDREFVTVHLAGLDAAPATISGTIDQVGRDYCEITVVRDGEARRVGNVAGRRMVPFAAIAALSSATREPR